VGFLVGFDSPSQQGVEGTECEEVWMITAESMILFTYASFVRNHFVLPHQEGIFFCWLATGYISLRNSWELRAVIPILRVPIQPLMNVLEEPYGMFEDFQDYPWVLPTYRYTNLDSLLTSLQGRVIDPAERKALELTKPS
jgi:hypothetical protein